MGKIYYVFLAIVMLSFLACIVITVFDNPREKKEKKKKKTTFKSRRTLYNNFVDKMPDVNYYCYSSISKQSNSNVDFGYTTEINIKVSEEPQIVSVVDYNNQPVISNVTIIRE